MLSASLCFAGPRHNLVDANDISREQDGLGLSEVIPHGATVPLEHLKTEMVGRPNDDGGTWTHKPDPPATDPAGIAFGIRISGSVRYGVERLVKPKRRGAICSAEASHTSGLK